MTKGTIETPERLKFDEIALGQWMSAHVPGFAGPLEVKKFAGGESNPTYQLVTPTRKYVLRRKPPGKLLPSAHAVDREYRVMTALGQADFPVPPTYALCEDESVIGTMFFVMDFIDGRIFWDWVINDVSRQERRALFEAAIDNLVALHLIEPQSVGLEDYGKTTGYFARQIKRWSDQFKAAQTDEIAEMDQLIEWLPGAVPKDENVAIVHGDYKIDNLVFHPQDAKVIATLDWELSTLGHPLADFSYFLMPWGLPKATGFGIADVDFEDLNIPTLDQAISYYCAKTGQDGLPDINFCMAYNMFRMAGIVQGVYKRSLQGNASSTNAQKYGAAVPLLAKVGWSFAQKAGG